MIPLGKEDYLKGQIDVLNQKAIIYSDSDQFGSTYEVVDIPADQKPLAEKAYQDLVEQMCDLDEEVGMLFWKKSRSPSRILKRPFADRPSRTSLFPWPEVLRSRIRASNTWWMRSWTTCPARWTFGRRRARS